ncbi:Predicted arabinose efflux permease, MFS family [Chitinophaga terrae (ex Kim and Jung 2007)]|uniref:Predicted arabinose efflux permease, MFS family n=1 Tax=Chitinophaga terrae (ex Kim and Jung 2007) TaxID=408074 RepID=A0A1H4A8M8_9BACT|nr:MFS transporter [Chitinophaga terrae (ex Kim and Jung 2007)]MDQ0105977.1 MFS family permease [Chitinophaga terrae (ex Kim and Jung 2007)]GEP90094.1 MFS transporter [Chitinophaga terrae (ex Kim and Jung 2007)]SEA32051.1 Predicted arabinose efflux permease, MFS family [Chitinophaga terrae (ex Kim and Jung 2007)]
MKTENRSVSILNIAVIVASLGYFVDIYDLLLFTIVRVPSLKSLGLSQEEIDNGAGLLLINIQMVGLLIGGIVWGIIGDKKGRLSVLFGSILIYSIANIANGFVQGINGYVLWRFVAGFGLAGELGAGITLVSEILPKEKRGYGTMIVATVGVSGAVAANLIAKLVGDWRICYFIGGGLGLALLILRVSVMESQMFNHVKASATTRGSFVALFTNKTRFLKYLKCMLLGAPTWFVVGILVAFSNKFASQLQVQGAVNPGDAIAFCYAGLVLGDLCSGLLSQLLKSRRKVMLIFLVFTAVMVGIYLNLHGAAMWVFYTVCFVLGFSVGFWAIFVTIAAESFGTNLRATVATTVPNFARGMLPLISILFVQVQHYFTYLQSGGIVAIICIGIALIAAWKIEETFGKDLNYVEEI